MYCWLAKAQAHLFNIGISFICSLPQLYWLCGLAEFSLGPAPGKVHEGRSAEGVGKETAEEMPHAACQAKAYAMSGGPGQSVGLAYVWWQLSDRDQAYD